MTLEGARLVDRRKVELRDVLSLDPDERQGPPAPRRTASKFCSQRGAVWLPRTSRELSRFAGFACRGG